MKDTIYFRHDYNSHVDQKIIKLRVKYGREGYGLFRAILEIMREDADIIIKGCELDANAYRLHCDIDMFASILHYCVEIGLFIYDKKLDVFYSPRLQSDVEYMRDKSVKASNSAKVRREKISNDANALQTDSESNAIKERKRKEKKENNKKSDIISSLEFIDEDVKSIFIEFVNRRKKNEKNFEDSIITRLYNKLNKLSNNKAEQIEIIEKSLVSNWKDFFQLKGVQYKQPTIQEQKSKFTTEADAEKLLFAMHAKGI